ncbi:zinc-ribbon domain-containing protein [Paenibacillus gansuensis]|uniref:Zinc-ribbon domain-containing protein n=1 Tax=Paenibacillus gansuensis TaxID=306542 RepID=A0ABW5PHH3_9BACL
MKTRHRLNANVKSDIRLNGFRIAPDIKYSFPYLYKDNIKYWDFEKNSVNPYTLFPRSQFFASLAQLHPLIAKDWDYIRNHPVTPKNIKPRARKKFWWICPEKGHSYPASPDNRVGRGSRCPYCYGHLKSRIEGLDEQPELLGGANN